MCIKYSILGEEDEEVCIKESCILKQIRIKSAFFELIGYSFSFPTIELWQKYIQSLSQIALHVLAICYKKILKKI